jgi:hypothetical protein
MWDPTTVGIYAKFYFVRDKELGKHLKKYIPDSAGPNQGPSAPQVKTPDH